MMNIKKITGISLLASMIMLSSMTGCSQKPAVETAAPVDNANHGTAGTPETTEVPAENVEQIFAGGDKDYYVPFSDPEHSYCTVTEGWSTPVREQGLGGCYAYAAVSSMQSGYLKEHGELIDINPTDLIKRIYAVAEEADGKPQYPEEKFYIDSGKITDLGGNFHHIVGSLCAQPLNGYLIEDANIFGCYNMTRVDRAELTEDDVKDALREYGALNLIINYTKACKYINGYYTQNYKDNGTDTNHVAAIVGWDDNFPADCFADLASRNGAWLVQNSFGEFWGNLGYYWVSYDMPINTISNYHVTNEFSSAMAYGTYPMGAISSREAFELSLNTDPEKLNETDLIACDDITVASVYENTGSVAAVGCWAFAPGQTYTIEILDGEFGDVLATKSGTFEHKGYHTIRFDSPVPVQKFTVTVKTSGVALCEGESYEDYSNTIFQKVPCHYEAKIEPGRSFLLADEEWVDMTDPELASKVGVSDLIEYPLSCPGDPCITVLFK